MGIEQTLEARCYKGRLAVTRSGAHGQISWPDGSPAFKPAPEQQLKSVYCPFMNPVPVSPFLSPYWRDEKIFRRSILLSLSGRSYLLPTAGPLVLVLLAPLFLAAGCDNNGPVQPQGPTTTNLPSPVPVYPTPPPPPPPPNPPPRPPPS